MAYVISDSCVSCGTCEPECPVGAISSLSMQVLALAAELVQEFVLQELSAKNNPQQALQKYIRKTVRLLTVFSLSIFLIMVFFSFLNCRGLPHPAAGNVPLPVPHAPASDNSSP